MKKALISMVLATVSFTPVFAATAATQPGATETKPEQHKQMPGKEEQTNKPSVLLVSMDKKDGACEMDKKEAAPAKEKAPEQKAAPKVAFA